MEMTGKQFAEKICNILSDKKAQEIMLIDVRGKTEVADYYVVAGGRSMTHTRSLIEHVDDAFTAIGWLTKIETEQSAQRALLEELQSIVEGVPEQIENAKRDAILAATGGDPLKA